MLVVIGATGVFRRGDFPRHQQANHHPGKTGMSYNLGAIERPRIAAS